MTKDKKTTETTAIVSLASRKSETGSADGDLFFKDPAALIQHISNIATLDASGVSNHPEKPATRVSSLDSFRASSPKTSFVLKKTAETEGQAGDGSVGGNVKAFPKSSDKPRKK